MKILIVDDSKAMRMIVQRTLRQAGFGDHDVTEAANGVEAMSALEQSSYDLVLSDWNMPEMSGIELLKTMRSKGLGAPFGFVTSEGTPPMRQAASDAGALFLIAKPFTAESFEQALRPVLR